MNRVAAVLVAALGLILAPQTSAAQMVYEDGTFDLGNWSEHGAFLSPAGPGGRVDSLQLTSGGNPGNHLRFEIEGVSVPLGTNSSVWGILIRDPSVYDPANLGPIQSIDFAFEGRRPPGSRGSRVVTLAVQQGIYLWAAIAKRAFIGTDNWDPKQITGLVASDFTPHTSWTAPGQPANPDFSATGSPIAFGVVTGTSCPATVDCSGPPIPAAVDIDNWEVTVESGPKEPFVVTVIDPDGDTDLQYDYGAYTVGTETRRTFILANDGSEGISIQSYDNINPPFAGPFLSTFGGIAPGSSGDFTIGFNPTAVGSFNTQVALVFTHGTTTLNLSGQGVAVAARDDITTDILNDPSDPTDDLTLDFGTVVLNDTREGRITVTNGGGATLDVDGITAIFEATPVEGGVVLHPETPATDPPFVVDNSCEELYLLAGESCLIRLIFRPEAEGEIANGLRILFGTDLDSRFVRDIILTGRGIESPIEVTDSIEPVDDRELAFGRIEPAEMRIGTVTLANVSDQSASIGSLAEMLEPPFFLEMDGCSSQVLGPIQECRFDVRYEPVGIQQTSLQQQLAIPINAPTPLTINLVVTGGPMDSDPIPQSSEVRGNCCTSDDSNALAQTTLLMFGFAFRRRFRA